jgi:hypothetical protein
MGPPPRYSSAAEYGSPELVQFGQIVVDRALLEPGETTRATVQVVLRKGAPGLLRLGIDVLLVRSDRIEVDESQAVEREPVTCSGRTLWLSRWPLHWSSRVQALTESDREIVTAWQATGPIPDEQRSPWWPDLPTLHAQIQHLGKPCEHLFEGGDQGLESRSMMGWAGAVTEQVA